MVVAATGTLGRKGIARKGVLFPCGLCRGGGGGGFGLAVDEPLFDQCTTLFQTSSGLAAAVAAAIAPPNLVLDVFPQRKLRQPTAQAPIKEGPTAAPGHRAMNDVFGRHASGGVVQIGEMGRDLQIRPQHVLCPCGDLFRQVGHGRGVVGPFCGVQLLVQPHQDPVQTIRGLDQFRLPVFDGDDPGRFQDTWRAAETTET